MKNIQKLNELIQNHFKISKNANLSIGITYKGINEKFLLRKNEVSPYKEIHYGIGSISKTFISLILSEMINQKEISLHHKVSDYFSVKEEPNTPTILELSTHTSGYSRFNPFRSMITSLVLYGFCRKNFYGGLNDDWLDNYISTAKIRKKVYHYSDFNYAVLGRIISKVKGKELNTVFNDFITNILQLKSTYFITEEKTLNKSWIWESNNPFRSSGGIASTIDDMLLFIKYHIKNKRILSETVFGKHKYEKNNIYSGFSWNSFEKSNFYWHHGAMGYYRSSILIDTKRDIGVIVMSDIKGGRIQRMGHMTSQIYRSIKRNKNSFDDFINNYIEEKEKEAKI